MLWKSIKNNIFLYSLSLSNTINYIFYFPLIILYLLAKDDLSKINYIQIYLFFVIYDLIRNLSADLIRKISKFIGINKIITINLLILALISFLFFFIFIRFYNNKESLTEIIIFRVIISLFNISSLFISKIISNIFEKKEIVKKLKFLDFYEKLNNFLVFVFILFISPSLSLFHFYFLCSFIFNLYFSILFIIFFKCHDEKSDFALYEEKINEKKDVTNNRSTELSKNVPKKKLTKRIISKDVSAFGAEDFSKSDNKARSGKRKSTAKIMINDNINLEKASNDNDISEKNNENNENADIENNMIVLTTNNNQVITSKDISNNENNNIQYQKQNIYIVNNVPISSSQRVLHENLKKNNSIIDLKNVLVTTKRKWKFICLILIPSKFLKYLSLLMLFLKTNSLKNVFSIKIHLLFYCGYFFLGIPVDFFNKIIYAKIIKITNGKKILLTSSFILSILSIIGYIFLFLHPLNNNQNKKLHFLFYVLFFILNFFLKEGLIVVLRIFYTISIGIGFTKLILRNMKEISIILACLIFFGYYVSLLFIRQSDKLFDLIVFYVAYYFIPIFFLVILFINTIYIL